MPSAVVGVSGGVDSAVSAARLIKKGFKVTGVFLDMGAGGGADRAHEVCGVLGIPLVVQDARDMLERLVIQPFIESYISGTTPIPCVFCNPAVKFHLMLKLADELGAEYAATGHYAGITEIGGEPFLRKGIEERDQSYMLYRLPPETLKRCLFPIGDTPKDIVRREADELGLAAAKAPDSMEICFVPNGDYVDFIRSRGHSMPEGDFVDAQGNVIGRHSGLYGYTVGQRRGLGIADTERLYVIELDAANNRVVLGGKELLYKSVVKLKDVIDRGTGSEPVEVKIRHGRVGYTAMVEDGTVTFTETPARAPAPGQSAVFYRNGVVLGGGIIC